MLSISWLVDEIFKDWSETDLFPCCDDFVGEDEDNGSDE